MQKITPFLWFNHQAEEAVKFYRSVFKKSKVVEVMRYPPGGPGPAGSVMTVTFSIEGREFIALNGGPHFQFSQAISFFVLCDTQKEVDRYWNRLSEGGEPQQCGWLKDKFGVTWQIVPKMLGKLMQDKDKEKARRVTQAMLKMVKLDIQGLKDAHAGR